MKLFNVQIMHMSMRVRITYIEINICLGGLEII